jgi:hypothetical protein
MKTYQVRLLINDLPHTAEVVARDREEAQEIAIEWAESCNLVHGEVLSIRLVRDAVPAMALAA